MEEKAALSKKCTVEAVGKKHCACLQLAAVAVWLAVIVAFKEKHCGSSKKKALRLLAVDCCGCLTCCDSRTCSDCHRLACLLVCFLVARCLRRAFSWEKVKKEEKCAKHFENYCTVFNIIFSFSFSPHLTKLFKNQPKIVRPQTKTDIHSHT